MQIAGLIENGYVWQTVADTRLLTSHLALSPLSFFLVHQPLLYFSQTVP
jgi:hypothetical protein